MADGVIPEDYVLDGIISNYSGETLLSYGTVDDESLVLWNTETSADEFIEFVRTAETLDSEKIHVGFENSEGYTSKAENIQRDVRFGSTVESLETDSENAVYSIEWINETGIERSGLDVKTGDGDQNLAVYSSADISHLEEVIEEIRPGGVDDESLEELVSAVVS